MECNAVGKSTPSWIPLNGVQTTIARIYLYFIISRIFGASSTLCTGNEINDHTCSLSYSLQCKICE